MKELRIITQGYSTKALKSRKFHCFGRVYDTDISKHSNSTFIYISNTKKTDAAGRNRTFCFLQFSENI